MNEARRMERKCRCGNTSIYGCTECADCIYESDELPKPKSKLEMPGRMPNVGTCRTHGKRGCTECLPR